MGLTERLQAAARPKDGLRFDDFMAAVLYDDEGGYFSARSDRAGRSGDFVTAPETSPMFAECVAEHLRRAVGDDVPESFAYVEVGAGKGTLAHGVRQALAGTPLGRALRFQLVEKGDAARRALSQRFGQAATIHVSVDGLPAPMDAGVIVANELFDNLPVRRVMQTDRLQEIRIRWVRGRFEEILGEAPEELHDYFRSQNVRLRSGQTAEACIEAAPLLARAVDRFGGPCSLVIIDYGDEADRLYAPDRFPGGTLACHRRHGTDRAYYEDLGRKDLTAHVNFTPLRRVLEERGFDVPPLQTQADFLLANGLVDRMAATHADAIDPFERMQRLMRAKQLFHPEAMGEAFRVMTARRA